MMAHWGNDDRAGTAEIAIRAFERATKTDREDALADLLCNLMHWSRLNGTDFKRMLWRAENNFEAEVGEEVV